MASRRALGALVLVGAGVAALWAAGYRERTGLHFVGDDPVNVIPAHLPAGDYTYGTPWWTILIAVAVALVRVAAALSVTGGVTRPRR